ncbi:3-hydroxyacyl-CoA dehydrogenase NAD-binding domain-containing protein [Halorutilales archaeon Cl-col2-1]
MIEDVETIAVLGAGTMGHGIAEVAALAGYDVNLRDIKEEFVQNGYDAVEDSVESLDEKGKIDDSDEVMSRITPLVDMGEAVGDADYVIEAVPEKMEIKQDVWGATDEEAPDDAVFASNTSSLSITRLSEITDRPESFVGMHFFNPPVIMDLVEVIRGDHTSDETVEKTEALAEDLGKTPVRVSKDSPGFIVNRLLIPYINEACWTVEEGEASLGEVDAVKNDLGLPMGPFELSDQIGNDINLDILEYLQEEIDDSYEPCPLLEQKVEDEKLGRKTGEGFYDYDEEVEIPDEGVDPLRVMCIAVNEGAKLVDNNVADPERIDTAMKLGAAFSEGPMEYADERGLDEVVEELDSLEEEYGAQRYEASDLLRQKAESGETFH